MADSGRVPRARLLHARLPARRPVVHVPKARDLMGGADFLVVAWLMGLILGFIRSLINPRR